MKILVTGGRGMLASNLKLSSEKLGSSENEYIFINRSHADLRDFAATQKIFRDIQPDAVIHTAARVGGIAANMAHPAEFLMDNIQIDSHVLKGAVEHDVNNVLYFGSSCMYPKDYRQPLVETDVLAAPLEPTNEGYALSKIAAARYCEYASAQYGLNYKVLIPSNLYGPGDDYTPGTSHLVASTLVKAHEAKMSRSSEIDVWGDGTARREFTFVGDVSDWVVSNINSIQNWPTYMNLGLGIDYSVKDFYEAALATVGYECDLQFDTSKPAGMKQKLMDSSVAKGYGWNPTTNINDGMASAYSAFLEAVRDN